MDDTYRFDRILVYRTITVEISTITTLHNSVTVDFDHYRSTQLGNG